MTKIYLQEDDAESPYFPAETLRIRERNDEFRTKGVPFNITVGVAALGGDFTERAIQAVREFKRFTPQNDPFGEHDFGDFELEGHQLFWKIDYVDRDRGPGAVMHGDPSEGDRILTVMLAHEY